MRFWDSSAVVALVARQRGTTECRALAQADREMLVWWGTMVECESALSRMVRTGEMPQAAVPAVREAVAQLGWKEVAPSSEVRDLALVLLRRHPLNTGDALQLAAALSGYAGSPLGRPFVTLDRRLATAAAGEGFTVIPQL